VGINIRWKQEGGKGYARRCFLVTHARDKAYLIWLLAKIWRRKIVQHALDVMHDSGNSCFKGVELDI
jgi:hypothetical protein